MAAFDLELSRVRAGADDCLLPDRINQLARDGGHVFRNTTLTPGNTRRLFAQQIACGNIASSSVQHLAGVEFSDNAWCQARKRLPMPLIRQVHLDMVEEIRRELDQCDDAGDGQYRWPVSMAWAPSVRNRRQHRFDARYASRCGRIMACPSRCVRDWVFPCLTS